MVEHQSPKLKVLGSKPNARDRTGTQVVKGGGLQNHYSWVRIPSSSRLWSY